MSFFNDLMGKSASNSAKETGQKNDAYIDSGFDSANAYATQGYGSAQGRYSPYAAQGQAGWNMYGNAMGLNGNAARQEAFGNFQSDPFTQYARQDSGNQLNSLFRRYGSQGMANSGAAGLAVSRAAGERAQSDVNNWLNRMQGIGGQGLGIAQQQAGLDMTHANAMGGYATGRAGAHVQNNTAMMQAMMKAKAGGINNLLSGAGGFASLLSKINWNSGDKKDDGTAEGSGDDSSSSGWSGWGSDE